MNEYILRIRASAVQKGEITFDELKYKLEGIEKLVIKEAEGQLFNVEYDGTIAELYTALPYDEDKLTITELAHYKTC